MAEDKPEQSTEDVLQMLDSLDKDVAAKKGKKKSGKNAAASAAAASNKKDDKEDDIMGFLDSLTKSGANSGRSTPALGRKSDESKVAKVEETVEDDDDDDEEEENTTNESAIVEDDNGSAGAAASVASPQRDIPDPIGALSSWWTKNKGGIWDSASSAVKTAEQKVRELQPEVQQNSQQAIDNLSGSISRFGITSGGFFKSVLDTIAPPIERHEQLRIHIFHDMVGYKAIDTIVYSVFERVMQQVEGGGELQMVVQKGKERHRRGSDASLKRDLNVFKGDFDAARKLAAANVEEFIKNKPEKKPVSEDDRIRISDIYLSIQPTAIDGQKDADPTFISPAGESFYFVIYLTDPEHDISHSTISQPFPSQWAEWLDSPDAVFESLEADPRDWITDWVEEGLSLAVGVVAQNYVSKRMGVDALLAKAQRVEGKKKVQE